MYTAILFDLDGTLTDPREGILKSVQNALTEEGFVAPPIQELEWIIGPSLRESFATIANLNVTDERIERLMLRYRERFGPIGVYENHVFPEVPALLTTLREQNIRCFVATSKPTVYAEKIVTHFHLNHYFTKVLGSELDGTRENKAEIIQTLVEEFHLEPEKTLMVGDRKYDMIGAKKNNMHAAGVLYGFGSRAELLEAQADHLANSPIEILNFIR